MSMITNRLKANIDKIKQLTLQDVPELRRAARGMRRPSQQHPPVQGALTAVSEAFPAAHGALGLSGKCHCGEAVTRTLSSALRQANRPDLADAVEAQPALPGSPASWKKYQTNKVIVVYTLDLAGLPDHSLQGELIQLPDGSMAPAQVQATANHAEQALQIFANPELNLRPPRGLDANGRLEIRLLDLDSLRGETDPRWSYIAINRTLSDDDARITVGHEIFHRIQYAYNPTANAEEGLYMAMREGGARLAEECILDSANRYMKDGFLDMPARPLVHPSGGVPEPHAYSAGLFWKFVSEQHGSLPKQQNVTPGFDAYLHVLNAMGDHGGAVPRPYSIDDLRAARAVMDGPGTFDRFLRIEGAGKHELISTETTWGNFLAANLLHQASDEMSDRRFQYSEETSDPALWHTALVSSVVDLPTLQGTTTTFRRGSTTPMPPFSASYYRVNVGDSAGKNPLLKVSFETTGGMVDPLVQLALIGPNDQLVDLIRLDGTSWTKTLSCADLDRVVVIASARETEGSFTLGIQEDSGCPLVSTTRWNCDAGDSFERDWRSPWSWKSPDLKVTEAAGHRRAQVRVCNRGDRPAVGVTARFAWQEGGSTRLDGTKWRTIGETATATLAPGECKWLEMDWAPQQGMTQDYVLKAEVIAPNDPNVDDKIAMSAFGAFTPPDFGRDAVLDGDTNARIA